MAALVGSNKPLDEAYERQALEDAGNAGGAYLDLLEKTDLATLELGQWDTFLRIVVNSFGDSIRRQARDNDPPF